MKEFIEELQDSGEASRIAGKAFVEERVWSPRNPGRGTVRKRFQHYRDFITLQGTKYNTEILAALLSPGSKCAHNLLQLARKVAGNSDSPPAPARKIASNSDSLAPGRKIT